MSDWLVVGLGNPGAEYAQTLHNLGAAVVEVLAVRHGGRLKRSRHHAFVDEVRLDETRVTLAFPTTYMNESGRAVGSLWRWLRLDDTRRLIVVHDELDLEPGSLRVKVGGGLAGHNGLRSITDHLGTPDYVRVRIGVGKPPSKERGAGHVLARIPARMRAEFDIVVAEAADAVEAIIGDGAEKAMNRFNG